MPGRDGPSLWVQAAQAPSCCHSGETWSHHHCPAMLRTLGLALLALLALVIIVNPSQASGFTGEGSGLCVGDAGGARAPRRGSPEDNSPAESGGRHRCTCWESQGLLLFRQTFCHRKRGDRNASESAGGQWGSRAGSESWGLGWDPELCISDSGTDAIGLLRVAHAWRLRIEAPGALAH